MSAATPMKLTTEADVLRALRIDSHPTDTRWKRRVRGALETLRRNGQEVNDQLALFGAAS